MKNIKNILFFLDNLSSDLKNSKNGAFEYIDLIMKKLIESKDDKVTIEILTQFKASAKMVYVGNFTSKQEGLWSKAWEETDMLSKNP